MVIGYVFSRTNNEEYEIIRAGPPNNNEIYYKKLYELFKSYIFNV